MTTKTCIFIVGILASFTGCAGTALSSPEMPDMLVASKPDMVPATSPDLKEMRKLVVTKNISFGDKSAANPTGAVNASGVKVASLIITNEAREDIKLSQIVLTETAGICIGASMKNLAIRNGAGVQLGAGYADPSATCATANTYSFNLSPPVTIVYGSQYVVDVFADLVGPFTAANTALVRYSSVTGFGCVTGSTVSDSAALDLQNTYIAVSGALTVQVDPDTPFANNYLMGSADQVIGKFRISATSTEAVEITQIVASLWYNDKAAIGLPVNVRLIDADTGLQIGVAAAQFGTMVNGQNTMLSQYGHVVFSNLYLAIPRGTSKTIGLKVDFTTYESGGFMSTGQVIVPAILRSYTNTQGTDTTVTAVGASSGQTIVPTVVASSGWTTVPGAYGEKGTAYRVKLATSWASDTPSGASSPSASQVVGKLVITNLANAGSYTATVGSFNFELSSTIKLATDNRVLTIYKDSLSTTPLAIHTFVVGQSFSGATTITAADFTEVVIASGASKTFYVTLDTSEAQNGDSLSLRVKGGGIDWSDGVSANLTAMGTDLPLIYKTFIY